MKYIVLLTLSLLIYPLSFPKLSAQSLPVVEVDHINGNFKSDLPFDTYFMFKGKIKDYTSKDRYVLIITPTEKKDGKYFDNKIIDLSNEYEIVEINSDGEYISPLIRPLRPSGVYSFDFGKPEPIIFSDPFKDGVKDRLRKGLNDRFKNKNYDFDLKDDLIVFFEDYFKEVMPQDLVIPTPLDRVKALGIFENEFDDFATSVASNQFMEIHLENNISQALTRLKTELNKLENPLDETLDPLGLIKALNETKTGTTINGLDLIDIILSIYHSDQIDAFSEYKNQLNSEYGWNTDGSSPLDQLSLHILKKYETTIDNSVDVKLNELFQKIVFQKIIAQVNIDVSTEKSPHLAYESGFGLRPSFMFDNFNDIVRFGSLNISLSPVNPNTPLRYFKPLYKVLKSLRVQIGLGKTVLPNPNERINNYFNERSVILGLGFRYKLFRLNYSGMLYNISDKNPTSDKSKIVFTPYLSGSLNIGINDLGTIINNKL